MVTQFGLVFTGGLSIQVPQEAHFNPAQQSESILQPVACSHKQGVGVGSYVGLYVGSGTVGS